MFCERKENAASVAGSAVDELDLQIVRAAPEQTITDVRLSAVKAQTARLYMTET